MGKNSTAATITVVLVIAFVAIFTIKILTKDIDEEISQQEIGSITQEKTAEITNNLLGIEKQKTNCNLKPKQREFNKQYYEGPLIDTHIHMPVASRIVSAVAESSGFENMPAFGGDLTLDYLVCLFDSEGIKKVFGFFIAPKPVTSRSVKFTENTKEEYGNKITALYMPTPISSIDPSPSEVEEIFNDNPNLYQGIGEIKFAFSEVENDQPEDLKYLEYYRIANDRRLIVQIHPAVNQMPEMERILKNYPNAKFLFHGGDIEPWIETLLKNHKNAYYSLDANLVPIYGWDEKHQFKSATKEEFLTYFRQNFESILNSRLEIWKPIIERNPNQFTWGTDRWHDWHFDQEVGGLIEEFGRAFIAQLSPEAQKKFAYENAEKMLQ
jgi:hypothetical protein